MKNKLGVVISKRRRTLFEKNLILEQLLGIIYTRDTQQIITCGEEFVREVAYSLRIPLTEVKETTYQNVISLHEYFKAIDVMIQSCNCLLVCPFEKDVSLENFQHTTCGNTKYAIQRFLKTNNNDIYLV